MKIKLMHGDRVFMEEEVGGLSAMNPSVTQPTFCDLGLSITHWIPHPIRKDEFLLSGIWTEYTDPEWTRRAKGFSCENRLVRVTPLSDEVWRESQIEHLERELELLKLGREK